MPSFKDVFASDESKLYGDGDDHYAQSRYLCLCLQEKGLLRQFVARFLEDQGTDPTAYATLRKILGNPDMAKFQARWERYVAGLDPKATRAPKPD